LRLTKITLRNFRCYKDEISVDFEDITVFIGKNDSGKSSIMEALSLFLNNNNPDKDDASKDGNPEDLTIICEFDDLPYEVIIDEINPTKLSTEYLLNNQGRLEIHKTYSGQHQAPKCTNISACAIHPRIDGVRDLLQLTNSDLKVRAQELDVDIEDIDTRVNAQIRERIRNQIGELDCALTLIPLNDDNAKKIWTGLQKYLPAFALFKSDRISTDQDPEAQDPMKVAVKEAIKDKEQELGEIADYVQQEVEKIADLTLSKIKEMDPTLATQLNPTFLPPKWAGLFKASITSDDDIPINKRGSGVKRLILLNFFRAKAEQLMQKTTQSSMIYAIEEPETSQHPNNQRMLLRALSDLSSEAQVIISTHTPMLARGLSDKYLRFIQINEDKTRTILKGGPDTNELLVQSLGVLPDNNVRLFIGVEGPNDINFLQSMAKRLLNEGVDVLDLGQLELNGEIIFIPLGGSNLLLWSHRLEGLNKPEFHLCDRDFPPPEAPKYIDHMNEVNDRASCVARCTTKKEIENYLHKNAILAAYQELGIHLELETNFQPFDDVPSEIARLIHESSESEVDWVDLSDEHKGKKVSRVKKILSSKATEHMTLAMLEEINPEGDLLDCYKEINTLFNLEQ